VSEVRSIFVTGAGRGLGLALAEEAAARGHFVVGTLRDRGRSTGLLALADQQRERVRVLSLDVNDEESCAVLGSEAARVLDRIDLVINNAGINSDSPDVGNRHLAFDLESLSAIAIDRMVRTNATSAILVTRALLPLLERSANGALVMNVSSRRGALGHKVTGGNYGYCMSKAALNMATRALAHDLRSRQITVVAIHPGAVRTAMAQSDATVEPRDAAGAMLDLTAKLTPAFSGRFLTTNGADHPW
jgi:NAD(P)-dependent dehydrogenase (short-subunit alcohol dehydrogenase family)